MIAYEYIKYFLISKGKHSFHSPYVYDFVTKCLTSQLNESFLTQQRTQISQLKNDKSSFEMADFGAGSRKLGKVRKVNEVFRSAATKGVFLKTLAQITSFYKPQNVLELGTSLGVGTFALTQGSQKVVTVDACATTQSYAKKYFPDTAVEVHFVNDNFQHFIENDATIYDLIFIDGHHDGEALKKYLKMLDKNSHDETIFVLDDVRWSASMLAAWNEIIDDSKYHLTMDLFKFGVVVKRHHQQKQHFIIRLKNVLRSLI